MSEQGAAPEIPEDLREWYWAINSDNPAICWRYETAISNEKAKAFIERIAALTLERDTLKAENEELNKVGTEVWTDNLIAEVAALKAKVERLSAPVRKKDIWFNEWRPIINAIGEISVQEAMDAIERGL